MRLLDHDLDTRRVLPAGEPLGLLFDEVRRQASGELADDRVRPEVQVHDDDLALHQFAVDIAPVVQVRRRGVEGPQWLQLGVSRDRPAAVRLWAIPVEIPT